MEDKPDQGNMIELTADIVSSYISNNTVQMNELPGLINEVHEALTQAAHRGAGASRADLIPAVSRKKSVTPDYIICLEDGKKFKQLKRHLRTHYSLTPEEYREKWGLAPDYPMVAPSYAELRSKHAKDIGLGRKKEQQS